MHQPIEWSPADFRILADMVSAYWRSPTPENYAKLEQLAQQRAEDTPPLDTKTRLAQAAALRRMRQINQAFAKAAKAFEKANKAIKKTQEALGEQRG